jgi:hypothetical protein
MVWQLFGLVLCLMLLGGCEAKIYDNTPFTPSGGGNMAGEDGAGSGGGAGRAGDEGGAGRAGEPAAGSGAGGPAPIGGAGGTGAVEPPIDRPPGVNIGGPYDLGVLPSGFTIEWPALPLITQEVEANTREEFEQAASVNGTRIVLKASITGMTGFVYTRASDLEIEMDDGVSINATIMIPPGQRRIRLLGGRYQGVLMAPTQAVNQPLAEDVMIDGVSVVAPTGSSAFLLRGHRIALIRSSASAGLYAVFTGVIDGVQNSDVIIAGNVLAASGAESTVRIVNARNSVAVDNRLTNAMKHNYRVHGISPQSYAARNVFIDAGTMFGNFDADVLDEVWFNDNTFYHTLPDLFHPDQANVAVLHARGNTAYTNVWACFLCTEIPAAWDLDDNQVLAYRPPP